jgi:hypothetical protein
MNSWIDLHALWRILVVGLICGAGLPALFAVGLKALTIGGKQEPAVAGVPDSGGAEARIAGNPLGLAIATVCFLVVLAAIAWGIYIIVNG